MTETNEARRVVAHVLPWKAIGGTELATLRIAVAAQTGGYHSVMFCRDDAPLVRRFFTDAGFQVVAFDAASLDGPLRRRTAATVRLARQFRAHGATIVHCADVYAGDFGAIAARLAGCRLVCHVRNRYDWLTRFQRLWLFGVQRLVFVSRHTGEQFGRLASGVGSFVRGERVVLYDGIASGAPPDSDPQAMRDGLGIPRTATVFGMVARLSVQKDHLTLVKAAERVCARHPDAWFLVVGDDGRQGGAEPEHARRVLDAIAQSPAASRFVCTGHRSDVPDLIAALDVFVLCTHREGLPLVIIEAMAMGKPVIATAVDGIPEIVIDERTGLLHRAGDVGGLAACLERLIDDPAAAAAMGRRGRELIEASFSEQAFVANVVALYRGLERRADTPASTRQPNAELPRSQT